jgi:hypothetical protein
MLRAGCRVPLNAARRSDAASQREGAHWMESDHNVGNPTRHLDGGSKVVWR